MTFKDLFILIFLLSFSSLVAQKPELAQSAKGPGGKIEIIKPVPGSATFAAADRNGNIGIYRFSDLGQIIRFAAHNRPINVISFNKAGTRMISASVNAKIKIWDTKTWKVIASLDQPVSGRITFAVFSPDEQSVYFDFNQMLYKISADFKSIKKVYTDETYSFLTCGMVSPDGKHLVFGSGKSIKVLDLSTDRITKEIGYCSSYINEIDFLGTTGVYSWCQDGTLNLWDIKKQGYLNVKPLRSFIAGKDDSWTRLYVSDDEKWMISGNGSSRINLYDPQSGTMVSTVPGHKDTVRAFTFTNENDVFISGGFDGMLNKWKIREEKTEPVIIKDTIKEDISTTNPKIINNRKVETQKHFDIATMVLNVEVWDDNIDGDIVSLNWNGKWVLKNYEIKKERKKLQLVLEKDKENTLILYAENLGDAPPNTARVTFFDGNREQVISINSDLKSCGSVTFSYKK